MTFEYTDIQLNQLNWSKNVYSVNPDYVERQRMDGNDFQYVVAKPDSDLEPDEKNKIRSSDGQQFQVIATKVDKATGFDGMAVAPIIDGQPDYNSVAVIAAATDTKTVDLKTALFGDWDISKSNGYYLSPQYTPAEEFVREVMDDERVKQVIQLSGYSQSSYMLKVGAKLGIPTTTFNAWFQYGSLSEDEKEFIRNNPGLFIDYRNNKDLVVLANDGNNPELSGYDKSLGTIYWRDGFSHKIEDWDNYDENTGRVINPATGRPFVDGTVNAIRTTFYNMKSFAGLKSHWSGGGISFNEELFLDVAQSYVIGQSMAEVVKAGLDEMTTLKTKADSEVEELLRKAKNSFSDYDELSYQEVQDIFASCGVSDQMVSDFQSYTEGKVRQMSELSSKFDGLKSSIDTLIETTIATDNKLGGEFQAWQETL